MKKFLFDLFPLILFFAAYKFADIYVATGVAMAAAIGQIVWIKLTGKPIEGMHWINLAVIVVFGGATLWFKDDAFIKWKPTMLYWLFGGVLLVSQIFLGRNLMQKLLGEKITMAASASSGSFAARIERATPTGSTSSPASSTRTSSTAI